jgi:hypothetical protein
MDAWRIGAPAAVRTAVSARAFTSARTPPVASSRTSVLAGRPRPSARSRGTATTLIAVPCGGARAGITSAVCAAVGTLRRAGMLASERRAKTPAIRDSSAGTSSDDSARSTSDAVSTSRSVGIDSIGALRLWKEEKTQCPGDNTRVRVLGSSVAVFRHARVENTQAVGTAREHLDAVGTGGPTR